MPHESGKEHHMTKLVLHFAGFVVLVIACGICGLKLLAILLAGNDTAIGWSLIAASLVFFGAGWRFIDRSIAVAGLCCAIATGAVALGVALVAS
jgi:hypothetical protein